jgi:hypothetical protein
LRPRFFDKFYSNFDAEGTAIYKLKHTIALFRENGLLCALGTGYNPVMEKRKTRTPRRGELSRAAEAANLSRSIFSYWKCVNPDKYNYISSLAEEESIHIGYLRYLDEQIRVKQRLAELIFELEEHRGGMSKAGKAAVEHGLWKSPIALYHSRTSIFDSKKGFYSHAHYLKMKKLVPILEEVVEELGASDSKREGANSPSS